MYIYLLTMQTLFVWDKDIFFLVNSYGHLMEMMSGEGKSRQRWLHELPRGSQKQARQIECVLYRLNVYRLCVDYTGRYRYTLHPFALQCVTSLERKTAECRVSLDVSDGLPCVALCGWAYQSVPKQCAHRSDT